MAKQFALVAVTLVFAIGAAGCGDDEAEEFSATLDSGGEAALEQAEAAIESAGYQARPAEQIDLVSYLNNGGTIEAEQGVVVTGKGQGIETFVLIYSEQADAEKVIADTRKRDIFVADEQDGVVYLAPDERTLKGIMDAAGG